MEAISILLVEDDASLGAATKLVLQSHARHVEWARDVDSAVAQLCEPSISPWDVLLLDLDLNGDLGESVIQLATRDACVIAPVVVVSAQPMAECQQRALAMGAHEVVRKPARPEDLIRSAQRAIKAS